MRIVTKITNLANFDQAILSLLTMYACDAYFPIVRVVERTPSGKTYVRDGKCVLTGVVNIAASWDRWTGFEAAHIFPLEKEALWNQYNFGHWITNTTGRHSATINLVQNGMLMAATLLTAFDSFLVSVNPDVSYLLGLW